MELCIKEMTIHLQVYNPEKRISYVHNNYEMNIRWMTADEVMRLEQDKVVNVIEMREYPDKIIIVIDPADYDRVAGEIF